MSLEVVSLDPPVRKVIGRFKRAVAKRSETCKKLLLQMNQEVMERSERTGDADFSDNYDYLSFSERLNLIYLLYDLRQLRFHFERIEHLKARDKNQELLKKKRMAIFDAASQESLSSFDSNPMNQYKNAIKPKRRNLVDVLRSVQQLLISRSKREFEILKLFRQKQLQLMEANKGKLADRPAMSKSSGKAQMVLSLTLDNIPTDINPYSTSKSPSKVEDAFKTFTLDLSAADLGLLAESLVQAAKTIL